MTCQECEQKLGIGEDAGEHLAACPECRWLAEELRLNTLALREMKVQPRLHWEWALAAAAAIVMAIGLWKQGARRQAPRAREVVAAAVVKEPVAVPVRHAPPHRANRRQVSEPLRVKMYTSDPDVVIYWIVDRKEGFE